jgi:hypothetical protein
MNPVVSMKVRHGERTLDVKGRAAWALSELIEAGDAGCTPIDHPGPRWSDYVFKLKKRGLVIETLDEKHGGPFAGLHARYVLKSPVAVIERVAA